MLIKVRLTGKVCKEHSFSKHGLADPKYYKQEPPREEHSRSFSQLKPWIFEDSKHYLLPVFPLHLTWSVQEQSNNRTNTLESDEDEIDGVCHFTCLVPVRVEAKIYSSTQDLACETVGEPVTECFTFIPRLRICDGDGGFGHPEYTSRDTAN
jgi:hypothetical protein